MDSQLSQNPDPGEIWQQAAASLLKGKLVVIPTDTTYGLAAAALNESAALKLDQAKGDRNHKPYIIGITEPAQLEIFQIKLTTPVQDYLTQVWPGPTSVILPCLNPRFTYLHHDGGTLAFRLPAFPALRKLIAQVGPLLLPSANPSGQSPATTLEQARNYFGSTVATYVRAHEEPVLAAPSALVDSTVNPFKVLRSRTGQNPN